LLLELLPETLQQQVQEDPIGLVAYATNLSIKVPGT